jgi:DNA-binding NarL/FixJ family response regulator
MSPIRVVFADDHPMFRFGLRAALDRTEGVEVVGEAADGAELLRLVADVTPDVVLTDLAMPEMDGIAAVATLAERHPQVATLVLTMNAADEQVLGALRAGASGYLLKDASRDEIARAILTVAEGGAVYTGEIGRRIVERLIAPPNPIERPFPELTDRELGILRHVAAGRSNREIADSLYLAEKTVRNNIATILSKLHLRDRAAAVAAARDAGL